MVFFVGALMLTAVVAWVVRPVGRPDPLSLEGAFEDEGGAISDLEVRKLRLLDAIKDADFDYQTGKLSSRDHRRLRGRFEKEVYALYREMDARGEASLLEEIEREVSELRAGAHRENGRPASCPACDEQVPTGARYCPFCGLELGEEKR